MSQQQAPPTYPHISPPEDAPWQDATLHGIAGWFAEMVNPVEGQSASFGFGGYFRHNSDGTIDGELIDVYGPAVISGHMTEDQLTFRKTYQYELLKPLQRQTHVDYTFERQGDRWVGSYNIVGRHTRETRTECVINLATSNAFGIGVVTRESLAQM